MLKFTVILPTIKRDSLQKAIHSVWGQTYPHWRLYVIDDTRDHEGHVWDHPASKTTMLCCNGPHNDSGAYARNFGILNSKTEWIAYIDCDDDWLPNHLETHARMIEESPNVSMFHSLGQPYYMKHRHPRSSKLVRKLGAVNTKDIFTVGMSHTRKIFNQTDGWKPGTAHDRDLWNSMIAAGGQSLRIPEITYNYKR